MQRSYCETTIFALGINVALDLRRGGFVVTVALVTGVGGFTGRHVVRRLQDAGYDVHGLIRHTEPVDRTDLGMLHVCELLDQERLANVVTEIRPDYVVHLAGISFVAHDDLDEMYRTNVLGTRAVLEACKVAGASPRAVLVASSASVYGNTDAGMLTENAPLRPSNDYAITKVAVENIAAMYSTWLPVIVSRPFNYTGIGQSDAFLVPKIVNHIKARMPTICLGNLDVARDFSDVRSVADAYCRLLEAPDAIGGTFNVCSGRAVTLRKVIATASEIAGYDIEVKMDPGLVRLNEVKLLQGSRQKLESVIGPLAMPSLRSTLQWMIES